MHLLHTESFFFFAVVLGGNPQLLQNRQSEYRASGVSGAAGAVDGGCDDDDWGAIDGMEELL